MSIHGSGFVTTSFMHLTFTGLSGVSWVVPTVVNSTLLTAQLPVLPAAGAYTVEYSLDGQKFTSSGVQFLGYGNFRSMCYLVDS